MGPILQPLAFILQIYIKQLHCINHLAQLTHQTHHTHFTYLCYNKRSPLKRIILKRPVSLSPFWSFKCANKSELVVTIDFWENIAVFMGGSRVMMESLMRRKFHALLLLFSLWVCGVTASVTYDHKAIVVNGRRRILISGSIHYPRSTPEVTQLTPLKPIWWCIKSCFLNHFLHFFIAYTKGFDFDQCVCAKWKQLLSSLPLLYELCFVIADVARPHSKGQRWRPWCHTDLCVLEWTWAFSWKSNANASP